MKLKTIKTGGPSARVFLSYWAQRNAWCTKALYGIYGQNILSGFGFRNHLLFTHGFLVLRKKAPDNRKTPQTAAHDKDVSVVFFA